MKDYINRKFIKAFLLFFLLFQCLVGMAQEIPPLRIGDLIFRLGPDLESHLIKEYEKGLFSHVGLIIETKPETLILHATTTDEKTHPNQVIISSFEKFTSKEMSIYYQIFRLKKPLNPSQQSELQHWGQTQLGHPFGFKKNQLYCTKLILNGLKQVHSPIQLEPQPISFLLTSIYLVNPLSQAQEIEPITPLLNISPSPPKK